MRDWNWSSSYHRPRLQLSDAIYRGIQGGPIGHIMGTVIIFLFNDAMKAIAKKKDFHVVEMTFSAINKLAGISLPAQQIRRDEKSVLGLAGVDHRQGGAWQREKLQSNG